MSASRPHVYSTNAVTNANESAANTETVIATLSGVTAEFAQQAVQFVVAAAITFGTTTTAFTLRIRRETLAGALVDTADVHASEVVASKLAVLTCMKVDSGREPAGAVYVLTGQGTGEGTAAAFNAVAMSAIVS